MGRLEILCTGTNSTHVCVYTGIFTVGCFNEGVLALKAW